MGKINPHSSITLRDDPESYLHSYRFCVVNCVFSSVVSSGYFSVIVCAFCYCKNCILECLITNTILIKSKSYWNPKRKLRVAVYFFRIF